MASHAAAGGSGKSDTSRRPPVIKNPLLSSQVTGLTLDDFAPVAVLLPAAPLPTIAKDMPESTATPKPVIFSSQQTVTGTVPELPQDTDNFSEIDLNTTSEPQAWSQPPTIDYNPLQDLEESDGKAGGSQLENDGEPLPSSSSYLQQTSALTAQFAAQLPNVASTVFSTFSRVIKGSSPVPSPAAPSYGYDPAAYGGYGSQPELQSVLNPYEPPPSVPSSSGPLLNSSAYNPTYQPFGAPHDPQHSEAQSVAGPPPPPPTFYNPEQVPSAVAVPPPSTSGPSNTYRLGGSKKKTYAHIPGLSTTTQPGVPSAPTPTQNTVPPHPFGSAPPTSLAFVQPTAPGVSDTFNFEPTTQTEDNNTAPPVSKAKSSIFGYLPTNILEKLPKPSFGSEKKEEPSQFAGAVSSGSILDQFAEPLRAPVEVQSVPPSTFNNTPQTSAGSYFAPPSVGAPVPVPLVPQSQPHPLFTPNQSEFLSVTGEPSAPTASVLDPALPPPVFYSPAQIPTVVQSRPVGSTGNPYSSKRLASGIGRYKNPLVPAAQPVTGPVFLPNQPPPLASQQPAGVLSNVATQQVFSDTFTPQIVSANPQSEAPVSIFNPIVSVGAPFEPVGEAQCIPPPVGERILENTSQLTLSAPISGPPEVIEATTVVNPLVPENVNSERNRGINQLVGGLKSDATYNPYSSQQVHQAVRVEEPTYTQQSIPEVAAPPVIGFDLQETSSVAGVEAVQAKFDVFNLGNQPSAPQTNVFSAESLVSTATIVTGTPAGFLGTEPASIGSSKTIVDSRSKSSENVLSPPPRPNSNLSEPATIFPGSVPPADIFLPELSGTAGFVLPQVHHPDREEEANVFVQKGQHDTNGNNLVNFFTSNPASSIAPVEKQFEYSQQNTTSRFPAQPLSTEQQEPSKKASLISFPNPAPAINPVDFFNSNTIVPLESGVENTIKTGQTTSSVPLFNFFGRTADPAPPTVVEPVVETKLSSDQSIADFANGQRDSTKARTFPEDIAPATSVSNVSSFSNLNVSFGEDSAQDVPRIENASNEPIFSSDNLFDFKSTVYQDGSLYSRNKELAYDANDGSSSMAAMATTSVGAQDTTTNTGTSIADSSSTNIAYRPTYNHWFYRREVEGKSVWSAFTMADSMALEDGLAVLLARTNSEPEDDSCSPVIVHTDGGRYDVSIKERTRTPVYWKGPANEVRRCSWFYKTVDSRFVPYEEEVADLLEREYKEAATSGEWHRRVTIPNGETVVFHGPSVIVHFLQTQNPDTWGGGNSPVPSTTNRPRVVKRGIDEFNIDEDEPERIDHLLFMVHGIGEACDLRFRRVEEVVDEFRSISAQLVQSHYRSSFDRGDVGRVEILPISWHDDLHSEESGVDEKLKSITLPSIPKLRHFTNDTLLDVLFYTSPMFCQSIIDAVGKSLNRLYAMFCQRNPSFSGRVSLAGHSLGSLILFDLLCHQKKVEKKLSSEPENSENPDDDSVSPLTSHHAIVNHRPLVRKCSQQINYEVGPAGTGQPYITYPQLMFQPKMFFALGSPIGMFVTIRGIDALGLDFKLPTCEGFFNIFHPYDPVAYRIEALINPELSSLAPVLIPHHKGRKRMHLELKETVLRVSNDLRQRVTDVFRNTLDTVYSLRAMGSKPDPKAIQKEVDKVLQDQLKFETNDSTSNLSGASDVDSGETNLPLGQLNQSRRVDYVLQEAPFEFINEYLFALTSHVCYWDSEDTMLFLMKEIYNSLGVQTDHQVPQQTMTIERPLAATSPTVAASSCSLNSNYNLFPHDEQSARVSPNSRL
ncbi:uncharacterized protein LOC128721953 [Anopheles nili]|uniref:uncharacterized protein LOC128721953 n=1 Tax=Anopheles nili TaxID=185578 RepID=UPI00237C2793|nr:uncharacterized protein LOC128721953 [Anopheles nili]